MPLPSKEWPSQHMISRTDEWRLQMNQNQNEVERHELILDQFTGYAWLLGLQCSSLVLEMVHPHYHFMTKQCYWDCASRRMLVATLMSFLARISACLAELLSNPMDTRVATEVSDGSAAGVRAADG